MRKRQQNAKSRWRHTKMKKYDSEVFIPTRARYTAVRGHPRANRLWSEVACSQLWTGEWHEANFGSVSGTKPTRRSGMEVKDMAKCLGHCAVVRGPFHKKLLALHQVDERECNCPEKTHNSWGIVKKQMRIVRLWPQKRSRWIHTGWDETIYEVEEQECQRYRLRVMEMKILTWWRFPSAENTFLQKGWLRGKHSKRFLTPLERDSRWSGATSVTQSQQSGSEVMWSWLQISERHEANSKPVVNVEWPGSEYLDSEGPFCKW